MAAFNITEFVDNDVHENGWERRGWWVGWIGERIHVVPIADSQVHISPNCACGSAPEIVTGRLMITHEAFDGRGNNPYPRFPGVITVEPPEEYL